MMRLEPGVNKESHLWTLPIHNAVLIKKELEKDNIDLYTLLKGTDITPRVFKDIESLLTYDQVVALIENALFLSPRQGLGLRIASQESPTDWGALGFAMLCCNTVGEVIDKILKFHKISGSMVELSFSHEDDKSILEFISPRAIPHILPFVMEHHMAAVQIALEKLTDRVVPVSQLKLSYSRPDYYQEYSKIFNCPIIFDQPYNHLIFESAYLECPIIQSSTFGSQLAHKLCAEQVQRQSLESDITHQVRYLLLAQGRNFPNARSVANHLHITSRTLRYRLKKHNTSFQSIRDDVRKQLAIAYLTSSNLSLEDIAFLVGFNDISNFRRAFKKWTDKGPSEYKKIFHRDNKNRSL